MLGAVIAGLFAAVDGAVAQTQRPAYEAMRYDEDWSVLRDQANREDAWDPVKYVPLGRPDWFLTLGGEARERYEFFDYPAFGYGAPDANGYLLQRLLLATDWHLGRRARVFAELQSGLTQGRNGLPIPSFTDRLDLHLH